MRKFVSIMLVWMLGASVFQAGAQPGQRRLAGSEPSPEVSRTVATSDERSAMSALRTRSVASPGTSLIVSPASLSHKAVNNVRFAAPREVSASLDVFGTVIFSEAWTEESTPFGVYKIPVDNGAITDKLFEVNKNPLYSFFDGNKTVYTMYELAYGSWIMGNKI